MHGLGFQSPSFLGCSNLRQECFLPCALTLIKQWHLVSVPLWDLPVAEQMVQVPSRPWSLTSLGYAANRAAGRGAPTSCWVAQALLDFVKQISMCVRTWEDQGRLPRLCWSQTLKDQVMLQRFYCEKIYIYTSRLTFRIRYAYHTVRSTEGFPFNSRRSPVERGSEGLNALHRIKQQFKFFATCWLAVFTRGSVLKRRPCGRAD